MIRRRSVLRALVVVALAEGRPVSSEELRYSLAEAEDCEPAAPSVRSELSHLAAACLRGRSLPPGLLPEREPGVGYCLSVSAATAQSRSCLGTAG